MRAARVAKNFHSVSHALTEQLDDSLTGGTDSSAVEYILQNALPLLKNVIGALCTSRPANPSRFVVTWLLEQLGIPQDFISQLQSLFDAGALNGPVKDKPVSSSRPARTASSPALGGDPAGNDADTERIPMPVRPPSGKKITESPRRRTFGVKWEKKHSVGEAPAEALAVQTLHNQAGIQSRSHTTSGATSADDPPSPLSPDRKDRNVFWHKEADGEETDCTEFQEEDDKEADDEAEEQVVAKKSDGLRKRKMSTGIVRPPSFMSPRRSFVGPRPGAKSFKRRFSLAPQPLSLGLPPENEVHELLRRVPAFAQLDNSDLKAVSSRLRCRRFESYEDVVNFGNPTEELHVIVDGSGKVSVPQQVGMVARGDYFGDAVVKGHIGAVNPAQVTAMEPLTTLSIALQDYQELGLKSVVERSGRSRVARDRIMTIFKKSKKRKEGACASTGQPILDSYVQTPEDRQMIIMCVKNNNVLGEVLSLSEHQVDMIADSMYLISLPNGATLIESGGHTAAFFIVHEGMLDVSLDDSSVKKKFKIHVGDSVGELGLLYDAPQTSRVTAVRECKLWVLPRKDFGRVHRLNHTIRLDEYSELLVKIPGIADEIEASNIDMVADIAEEISFVQGEEVCCEGADEGLLFICYSGTCDVTTQGQKVRTMSKGDWVGEEQLKEKISATETVSVTSEDCVFLVVEASSFSTVINAAMNISKVTETNKETGKDADLDHRAKQTVADEWLRKRMERVLGRVRRSTGSVSKRGSAAAEETTNVKKSQKVGVLGEGAFGIVLLMLDPTESAENKQYYALKAICKDHIMKENMLTTVARERSIMGLLESEFIVKFYKTYQDGSYIFFSLEACLGGDLFDVYSASNLFGDLAYAKFYIACVTLGLQHMHQKRVIYRDLKLENCLLDSTGYLKLTDMGIAKTIVGKTYTVCGTADYFAPETLKQVGHNRAADWWACGVLLFILAAGRSPFDAPEVSQIYKNIMKGFAKVKFPTTFPSDLIDVVKSLCRKKPEERVCMQKGGVDNLKEMAFFGSLRWDLLAERKLPPPFVPPAPDLKALSAKEASRKVDVNIDDIEEWDGGFRQESWPKRQQGSLSGTQNDEGDGSNEPSSQRKFFRSDTEVSIGPPMSPMASKAS